MRDELNSIPMVEVSRNDMLESMHNGVAIIIDWGGAVIHEWGDTTVRIFPRSAIKMIQALPLIETGAINAFGLGEKEVALACASHQGSTIHTNLLEVEMN